MKILVTCFILPLAALLLALPSVHAGVAGEALPVNPQLKIGRLPNGLTYYVQRSTHPANRVELRLVVKAGSVLEEDDQQGAAHFIEHLAFKRSARFGRGEMVADLQSMGIKLGADLNATTSYDSTVYQVQVPTGGGADMDKAFSVMADWAHGTRIDDADVDGERATILEEMRSRAGYEQRVRQVAAQFLAPQSRYPTREPIGTENVVRTIKADALRRYYGRWYRPDLMAVAVVGDIAPEVAEQYIQSHFGHLKNPGPSALPKAEPIAPPAQSRAVVLVDKEAKGNTVQILFPLSQPPVPATVGDYRQVFLRALLTSVLNARFGELAQGEQAAFFGAAVSIAPTVSVHHRGWRLNANVGKGGHVRALEALLLECERLRRHGVTDPELQHARREVMALYQRAYETRASISSKQLIAEYTRHFLMQESIPGIENEYSYAGTALPGVTPEALHAFARAQLPAGAAKLAILSSPTSSPGQFTDAEVLRVLDRPPPQQLAAWAPPAPAVPLMDAAPTGGSIVEEEEDPQLGLVRLRFANGVRAVVKKTDYAAGQILFGGGRAGGYMRYADEQKHPAMFAAGAANAMGLAHLSPAGLKRSLSGKTVSSRVVLHDHSELVEASAPAADAETLLQLVHLHFRQARRDPALFRLYLARQAEMATVRGTQPLQLLHTSRNEALFGLAARKALSPSPADIAALKLDEVADIYDARFASARGITFFIVGDVDLHTLRPLLAAYLGTLPNAALVEGASQSAPRPAKGLLNHRIGNAADNKGTVAFDFTGEMTFSGEEALRFRALVDVLNGRMIDTLRERDHLIYGGSAAGSFRNAPYSNYRISITLPCAPENTEQVAAITLREIERLQKTPVSDTELTKIKNAMLQSHRKNLRDNAFWMQRLIASTLDGTDIRNDVVELPARIAALGSEDIRAAAATYFDGKNFLQLVQKPAAAGAAP